MIDDLDRTIRDLLIEELPGVEEGQIDVAFDPPSREWSTRQTGTPTLNFYLYDVRENAQLRQHQMTTIPAPVNGAKANMVYQKRMPMRIDCFYIVTAWANDPLDEHRLLTDCIMVLYKHGILAEEMLRGRLREPPFPIRTRVASHDVLTNPAEVWSALDNEMRPGVSFVVTLALDPWTVELTPAVTTAVIRTGQLIHQPQNEDAADSEEVIHQSLS